MMLPPFLCYGCVLHNIVFITCALIAIINHDGDDDLPFSVIGFIITTTSCTTAASF